MLVGKGRMLGMQATRSSEDLFFFFFFKILCFREVKTKQNKHVNWLGICPPSKFICPSSKSNLSIAQNCPPSKLSCPQEKKKKKKKMGITIIKNRQVKLVFAKLTNLKRLYKVAIFPRSACNSIHLLIDLSLWVYFFPLPPQNPPGGFSPWKGGTGTCGPKSPFSRSLSSSLWPPFQHVSLL